MNTTELTDLPLLISQAKASQFILEYLSHFDAEDIDSDSVDLRFELDDADTGSTVSIVDECGKAAESIRALVEALESAQRTISALEKKLAKPVLLPKTNGYWTEQEKAYEEAITLVVEFEDGMCPGFRKGMDVLGGKLAAVVFRDELAREQVVTTTYKPRINIAGLCEVCGEQHAIGVPCPLLKITC